MTESVLNLVVGKLSDLITQEVNLLLGVDEQVRLLRHELQWMLMFIRDADIKRRSDPRVKLWVSQLREIAFHAEDVIDEFFVKIDQHRRRHRISSIRLVGYMKSCVHHTHHIPFLHELGSQIQVINTMTEKISANKSKYFIESIGESSIINPSNEVKSSSSSRNIRRMSFNSLDEESDVVGLQNDIKQVKSLLMNGEQRRAVVSIVGMGGLGKTTLAKKVYTNNDVRRHFNCFAWISISQEYRTKELIQGIIKSVVGTNSSKEKETEEDLRNQLREYIQSNQKKYLIVLDDIWDIEAWDVLRTTFPEQGNGSRVLITTRNKDIALHADLPTNIYNLRLLDEAESWELFLKRLVPVVGGGCSSTDHEPICPAELEVLGKTMVGRCGGLPLAIVVLGGVLSAKEKTMTIWSKVNDSLNWHLNHIGGTSNSCMGIIALSYYDLPYYLKPIFLYFGIFPEDQEIPVTKLIQYCVAEGFIKRRGKETLEDIAEDYLEVLIDKSMIQVTRWRSDGRPKYCRIHDLLRDLSIREAKEDKFFHLYGNIDDFSNPNNVRRVSIHDNDLKEEEHVFQSLSAQHLRSLVCFTVYLDDEHLGSFTGGLKLLRVLELRDASIDKLPNEIGQLIHLKYLGLRNTDIKKLPRSIGRLVNLQTLDIRYTYLHCIPEVFWTLHQLRHLYLDEKFCFSVTALISNRCFRRRLLGIDNLTDLQTLIIPAGNWIESDGLDRLRMLRKLVVEGSLVPYKKVTSSIASLNSLRSLELLQSDEIPNLESFSSFTYLYKLHLDGSLKKLPDLEFFPPNLNKLILRNSSLESDPMVILQQLPNLKVLKLYSDSYKGKKMVCSNGGFVRLQVLDLHDLYNLEEWIVEKGALMSLTHLSIRRCIKLKMIPDGLQELTTLHTLKLKDVRSEFTARVQKNGEDWNKIKHIPSVEIE